MGTPAPPPDPDALAVLRALSGGNPSPEDAYNAVEGIRSMAAANLIARFESKLDAQAERFEAKFDALNAKIDAQGKHFDTRLAALIDVHSAKFEAIDAKFASQRRATRNWGIAIGLAISASVAAMRFMELAGWP